MSDRINKLQEVFDRVFENCPRISEQTKRSEIEAWDSINHLALLLELEENFGVTFSIDEIEKLQSVKQILEKIEKKN